VKSSGDSEQLLSVLLSLPLLNASMDACEALAKGGGGGICKDFAGQELGPFRPELAQQPQPAPNVSLAGALSTEGGGGRLTFQPRFLPCRCD